MRPKSRASIKAAAGRPAGLSLDEALADPAFRGRLVESAVGAHLANAAAIGTCELFYWRGRARDSQPGMAAFTADFKPQRTLLVGGAGMSVEEFLSQPEEAWAKG